MIAARFVPIETWPGDPTPHHKRRSSPFRGSWQNTLTTLEREMKHLRATAILVQGYFRSEDIRIDGWPRSSAAKPSGPGVVVSFKSTNGDLSFPCDTFTEWRDNLRAIALGLAALRAVERYGVTRRQEQYRGWAKIAANGAGSKRTAAISFIARIIGWTPSQVVNDPRGAYRLAAAAVHPDTGGSHEQFVELQGHMESLQ